MTTRFTERIDDLIADATAAAKSHDWDAVRSLVAAVFALDPANERARQLRADAEAHAPPPAAGERRQLTVMFCDVVGSTALSERVDPELVRDVLRSYQATCDEVVSRYEGHIARYFGDGVLVYFGHPRPHEDDARRAVKAGLDLLDALAREGAEERHRHGIDLAVRIAVHTGFVVRADMGTPARPDPDAIVGDTPNIAARLQETATPGTLVISGSTYDLVQGFFEVTPLGPVSLKGVSRPVDVYSVVGEATGTRFRTRPEVTPFVGRDREERAVLDRWDAVAAGGSAAVLLRGEPGIGKSRLADQVRAALSRGGATVLVGACSAYHTTTHLYPARRIVEAASGLNLREPSTGALVQLRDALTGIGCADALPVVAAMLGLPPEPWCPAPELDGMRLREVTLTALIDCLVALAAVAPLLVVVEDLQWADPSTLELLRRVISRRIPGLLLLMTARPEFSPPATVDAIDVARLTGADLAALVAAIPQSRALPRATVDELMVRSDGVPLFVEELVRSASIAGKGPALGHTLPARFDIPAPLRDPLLARLAAPGVDLDLAQTMATIGREVRQEVLCAVAGISAAQLDGRVQGLVNALLVDTDDNDPSMLRFHHHLIGELAYETQLLPARKQRHAEIADVLRSAAFEGVALDVDAGAIAYHLERAGRTAEAISAYVQSSRAAMSHGAHAEAEEKLSHALSLLDGVDDDQERVSLELQVRQQRGFGALAQFGYAAPRAVEDFHRCLELSRQLDARPEHLLSLSGLLSYYSIQGDLNRAEEIVREMRAVEDTLATAPPLGAIPVDVGWSLIQLFRGDLRSAIDNMQSYLVSTAAGAAANAPPPESPLPNDVIGVTWAHLAFALSLAGASVDARDALARADARADRVPFPHGPFTKAYARTFGAMVSSADGDFDEAQAAVLEISEIADRHGFLFFSMCGAVQTAILSARQQQPFSTGLLEGAIAMWRATGADVWTPCFITELAGTHLEQGNAKLAIPLLTEAVAMAEHTGARFWQALTLALLGQARLVEGDTTGAADLEAAVALAAVQGAKLFEVMARTAQVRLLGDRDAAKALKVLLDSFDPRMTTPVLQAARDALA
jgi:class 3 adenylate cyclase